MPVVDDDDGDKSRRVRAVLRLQLTCGGGVSSVRLVRLIAGGSAPLSIRLLGISRGVERRRCSQRWLLDAQNDGE